MVADDVLDGRQDVQVWAVSGVELRNQAGAVGSWSMKPETRSKNVQSRPCVVTLRNALTPRPR